MQCYITGHECIGPAQRPHGNVLRRPGANAGQGLQRQLATNEAARARNARVVAEVSDLKEGLEMVEEKARFDLGMVKPDEIFVQISPAPR